MRLAKESGEKPPNTTQCTAPIRVHANIAMVVSGTIGIYSTTRSPFFTPCFLSTLAKRQTSSCSSTNEIILCREG